MARFAGEYEESFVVDAPAERVRAHFGNFDAIAANYGGLLRHQKIDASTMHLVLEPRSEKGVTFNGEYTCRYSWPNESTLTWETVKTANLWSQGRAVFTADGPNRTRVQYQQRIECEMQVNALLGKVVAPIVSLQIRNGVKTYLERMRRSQP
jgi:hypothetical protein